MTWIGNWLFRGMAIACRLQYSTHDLRGWGTRTASLEGAAACAADAKGTSSGHPELTSRYEGTGLDADCTHWGCMGGSGYHRAMLIDNFIHHFSEWCLFGTRNNADWGFDMWDVDNAFVAAGIGGGFIAFVAFIICAGIRLPAVREIQETGGTSRSKISD